MSEKDTCCSIEKITCKKKLFWKFFLVSFVFLTYTYIAFVAGFEGIQRAAEEALKVNPEAFGTISSATFEIWKVLVIQFTLIPALVFTWIEYDAKNKDNKKK
jgi:hypothetical protein